MNLLHPTPSRPASRLAVLLLIGVLGLFAISGRAQERTNSHAVQPIKLNFAPNLPIVVLEATGQMSHDQKTPCTLRLMGAAGSPAGPSDGWAGVVKIHGGVSQGYPKKSYAVTLAAPVALLDLRQSPHWVLNA